MANATAYIQDNHLCVMGIQQTPSGPVPFACVSAIEGEECKDGPVDVSAQLSPGVEKAMQEVHAKALDDVRGKLMQTKVRDIVLRSRAGDQNAIATIIECRKAAEHGVARARVAFGMLTRYIKQHPISKRAVFGEEKPIVALATNITAPSELHYGAAVTGLTNDKSAIVVLANGPEITEEKISVCCQACPQSQQQAFTAGFGGDRTALATRSGMVGYILRLAQKVQQVRKPKSDLRAFSPIVAWEHGL